MTRRILAFATVASALLVSAFAAGPAAATPGVAWQIKQGVDPTVLEPGTTGVAQYHVRITNVGGATAPAGVTITDTVPAGLTPVPGSNAMPPEAPVAIFTQRSSQERSRFPCSISGQTVICEVGSRAVLPDEQVDLFVPVAVATRPPATLVNNVEVSSTASVPARSSFTSSTGDQPPPFSLVGGPLGLSGSAFDEAGATPSAGSHPFDVQLSQYVPSAPYGVVLRPLDPLRAVRFEQPAGLAVDLTSAAVAERCTLAELQGWVEDATKGCPAASQIGLAHYGILSGAGQENITSPLIDMVPGPGVPAELALVVQGTITLIRGRLGENFHLVAGSDELLTKFPINGIKVDLWGNPSDPRHDAQRGGEGVSSRCNPEQTGCSIQPSSVPLVTMPTNCTESMTIGGTVTGWLGGVATDLRAWEDLEGNPVTPTGCNQLAFGPTIESKATTNAAESPSGLEFKIHQPQEESLEGRATAALKDATVTLPEGMSLNPSAANGLSSCTEQQMGYAPEEGKIRFATTPQTCPAAAKVGTMKVTSPLAEGEQPGQIFVAKPFDNPFNSLLAIYLAVEDEETGITAKLAGKVEPDPTTGQLKATFTENPELPLNEIDLEFFNGAGGVLTTPLTCGTKTTNTTLTPWSTPEGADVHPSDSFETSVGCSGSEGTAPKTVAFTAGTVSPLSGSYSPFVLRLSRPDGSQHITGVETTLPPGLLGKLAGVAYCPESGIAQARSREKPEGGKTEQSSPSCPSSSEVGSVNVTAGSGISPIPVSGHAYLAGPYKGAPLSLVVIVPAVAGPFDLGTVVDRVALDVGEYDARIHAVADPLPTIREGIPLDVRSIELKLDRPAFTLNPTSCEAMAIEGSVSTQTGQSAPLKNRFQVGECGRLAFKPKLAISLEGPTKRTGHPALKATVTYPKVGAYANIARAQVSLPHSEFLDQGNIGKACTKVLLAQRACPAKSVYGKVKAWTPLLDKPLEGPVYLVGGYGYKLPALVAELDGQIRVLLVGKIDTGKSKGIRNTFEAVPDAPVEKFVLELKGGKKYGLLENSEDICRKTQKAGALITAQNGKVLSISPTIANSCKKGRKKGHGKKGHGKKGHGKKSHGKKGHGKKKSGHGKKR